VDTNKLSAHSRADAKCAAARLRAHLYVWAAKVSPDLKPMVLRANHIPQGICSI